MQTSSERIDPILLKLQFPKQYWGPKRSCKLNITKERFKNLLLNYSATIYDTCITMHATYIRQVDFKLLSC